MSFRTIQLVIVAACIGTAVAQNENDASGDIFGAINIKDMETLFTMLQNNRDAVLAMRASGGITPLHYAASLNNIEAVYRLLDAGVQVDITTEEHLTTPLHWAVDKGAADALRLLLRKGANVNAKAKNGYTPLHFLARGDASYVLAKYLREAGADIDAVDVHANTPLHIAAMRGNVAIVADLIQAGARTDLQNDMGKLAVDVAQNEAVRTVFARMNAEPVAAPVPSSGVTVETLPPSAPSPDQERPPLPESEFVAVDPEPEPELPQIQSIAAAPDPIPEVPQVLEVSAAPAHELPQSIAPVPELQQALIAEIPLTPLPNTNVPDELFLAEEYRRFLNDPDTIKNLDGSIYKGSTKDGKYSGFGILFRPNRERYQGEWRRGLRHGVGTFIYANGDSYAGSWKNNVPHGVGIFIYANGGKIDGTWKNGVLVEGEGYFVAIDGAKYTSLWRNGKMINSQPIAPSRNAQ